MGADVIDKARIESLRKAMPRKAFDRSLAAFRNAVAERPLEFREAIVGGRWDEALRIVHSIKGVCANFGALALASTAERIEAVLEEGDGPGAADLADELAEAADRTISALDETSSGPA